MNRPVNHGNPTRPEGVRRVCTVEAVVKSGKFGMIQEEELDKIDVVLRKDLASCSAATVNRVAILYATLGKFDKAHNAATSVVNVYAVETNERQTDGSVAPIYALFLLIDVYKQKSGDPEIMVKNTWKTLSDLQRRRLIRNLLIDASFDLPEVAAAISYISLREGATARESVAKLRATLKKKEFVKVGVQVEKPGIGIVNEWKLEEIDREKLPKEDPPKVKFPEEC